MSRFCPALWRYGRPGKRPGAAGVLVLALGACAHPQAPVAGQQDSTHAISEIDSIDLADNDWRDLVPLATALGDSRIVLLGEPSHGDGTAFRAKSRLIRFLHEQLGFNVLAWESGVFEGEKMQALLESPGVPVEEALAAGLFTMWERSTEVRDLFAYARTTYSSGAPLKMVGIDPQLSAALPAELIEWIVWYIEAECHQPLPPEATADLRAIAKRFPKVRSFAPLTPLQRAQDRASVETVRQWLTRGGCGGDGPVGHVVDNIIALYEWHGEVEGLEGSTLGGPHRTRVSDGSARDRQMASNVSWVMRVRYPGSKVIVWTANYHALRAPGAIRGKGLADFHSMAESLCSEFDHGVYSIAISAYEGEAGQGGLWRRAIVPAEEGTLEAVVQAQGHEYTFLDLRSLASSASRWISDSSARPLGYQPMRGNWAKAFDGLFQVRTMEPPRLVEDTQEQCAYPVSSR